MDKVPKILNRMLIWHLSNKIFPLTFLEKDMVDEIAIKVFLKILFIFRIWETFFMDWNFQFDFFWWILLKNFAFSILENFINKITFFCGKHRMAEGKNVEEPVLVFKLFVAFGIYFFNMFVGKCHSFENFEFLININRI